MPDPVRRSAARVATLVAVPIFVVIAVGSLWLHGGFSGPPRPAASASPGPVATALVPLPVPTLPEASVGVCREVIAHLPTTVLGQARRLVTGPEQNAAYGQPPVVVACGVPALTVAPTESLVQISGVCWLSRADGTDATAWTTVDRVVPVRVTVPGAADGSAQVAAAFTTAIRDNDPVPADFPPNCNAG